MPHYICGPAFGFRRVETSGPQHGLAPTLDCAALVSQAHVARSAVGSGTALINSPLRASLRPRNCLRLRRSSRCFAAKVFILRVALTSAVERMREQTNGVDNVRLAAVVFAHQNGQVFAELHRYVGARAKPLNLDRVRCIDVEEDP